MGCSACEGNDKICCYICHARDHCPGKCKKEDCKIGSWIKEHIFSHEKQQTIENQKELFARFWKVYPKKRSKGHAERAWKKITPKPDEQLLQRMIAAIEQAKKTEEWIKEDGQFIPYPATWLNAKGWEDEIKVEVKSKASILDEKYKDIYLT
jgi:uncharacterized protein YeaO (DUF488 family)